jgi:hypothetical protein
MVSDYPDVAAQLGMFIVKLFTRRSPSTARYVFADSVAAAEGYSEQQKQGCSSDD